MSWLHDLDEFNTCPHNADAAVISRQYEVYLYYLLGGIMFCNSSGDYMEPHLIWLACELTAQPDEDISYSQRSVVFVMPADGLHLGVLFWDVSYSCKCGAGSTFLPLARGLNKAYYPIPISNDIPDTMRPTMGYRWMFARLR
jgi:hypothetical protein